MRERGKGIADLLVEQGTRLANRAAKAVIDDERGQEVVAAAVGAAQKGMRRLGEIQERVLHAVGLPSKADYEDVAKQMARLKRKIRDLSRAAERSPARAGAGGPGAGEAPGESAGGEAPEERGHGGAARRRGDPEGGHP
jgi:polyhydroxyalkanoate synthesis regulator phasin